MRATKSLPSRTVISTLLLFSFLALEDHGSAKGNDVGSEGSSSVDVTAQVSVQEADCAGFDSWPISFQPAVDQTSGSTAEGIIYIALPNVSDVLYIDFQITDGVTENCDSIFGHVTFTATGFQERGGQGEVIRQVDFLETSFECDMDPIPLVLSEDRYSCFGGDFSSPSSLEMNVTADPDFAVQGYFTNTISIDLYANP